MRQLPHVDGPPIETGVIGFGDVPPGVYLTNEDAVYWASMIESLAEVARPHTHELNADELLKFCKMLGGCRTNAAYDAWE